MFEWLLSPFAAVTRAASSSFRRKQPALVESPFVPCSDLGRLIETVRSDYQATVTFRFLQGRLQKTAIRFEANPKNPRAVAVARHLNAELARQFPHISEAPEFGRYTFTVEWANSSEATLGRYRFVDAYTELQTGRLALYSELVFETDKEAKTVGKFVGIRVFDGLGTDPIPAGVAGYFAFWATTGNPYGRSLYRGAVDKVVSFRAKTLTPLRAKWLQKCVVPPRMVRAPEIVKDPETGEDVDNWSAINEELKRGEAFGYFFFPPERDAKNEFTWDIEPLNQTTDPSGLESVVTNTDAEVSRAMGVNEELVSRTTTGGSNANSEVGLQTADAVADNLAAMIVTGLQTGWLEPHLERNGLSTDDITITRKVLLDKDSGSVKAATSLLTNNTVPPLVISGAIDVPKILRDGGIPLAPGASEAIDKLAEDMRAGVLAAGASGPLGASGKVPAVADGTAINGGTGPQQQG